MNRQRFRHSPLYIFSVAAIVSYAFIALFEWLAPEQPPHVKENVATSAEPFPLTMAILLPAILLCSYAVLRTGRSWARRRFSR